MTEAAPRAVDGAERSPIPRTLFRELNDRIHDLAAHWGGSGPREYVCECGDRACRGAVTMTVDEYEAVRAQPGHFVVGPEHPLDASDRLVARTPRFAVLENAERQR